MKLNRLYRQLENLLRPEIRYYKFGQRLKLFIKWLFSKKCQKCGKMLWQQWGEEKLCISCWALQFEEKPLTYVCERDFRVINKARNLLKIQGIEKTIYRSFGNGGWLFEAS